MEVAGANRRWRLQFRCRGSRRESAVAQLFSLGGTGDAHGKFKNERVHRTSSEIFDCGDLNVSMFNL